jgi:hypothetical protein
MAGSSFHQYQTVSSHAEVEIVPAKHHGRRVDLSDPFEVALPQVLLSGADEEAWQLSLI